MDYIQAVAYIDSLSPTLEKPSLNRIALFLKEEGDPQNKIETIHVGGTNGKGSTAVILDALLQALGLKVGRFTGPHLFSYRERISINGEAISEQEFASMATLIRTKSESFATRHKDLGALTWFEFLTAMAFFKFEKENIEVSVLEVGLGGRFDATNAAENVIGTIITSIDLDHTHILGNSVEEIAFEKAGIMKPGVKAIVGARGNALKELKHQAKLKGSTVVTLSKPNLSDKSSPFMNARDYILEKISLYGPHQISNAKLALLCLSHTQKFDALVNQEIIKRMQNNLANLTWPGRFQILEENKLIMDVAHNPASAKVLRSALDQIETSNFVFVVGFFRSKDVPGFLMNLLRDQDKLIACNLNTKRKFYKSEEIEEICKNLGLEVDVMVGSDVNEGISIALKKRVANQYIVTTGSFDVIRSTMLYLGWHPDSIVSNFTGSHPRVGHLNSKQFKQING